MAKCTTCLTGCLVLVLVSVVSSVDISSIFTICKDDANRNACLKGAIQDAFRKVVNEQKDLNLPSLDPLLIDHAVIPAGPGTVHVEQNYKNIKIFNIAKTSEIREAKLTISPEGFDIYLDLYAPEYRMEADYKFNGRVLLLPITGEGPCVIKLDDIETQVQISGDTVQRDGKTYGNVKRVTVDFIPKKATFRFENLFNGDKILGETMNKLLNDNWETLYQDVKESYQAMAGDAIMKHANVIFQNHDFATLFPK